MSTGHESHYKELTHQLANAGHAVASATGILPIASPNGHSPGGGGGPGANDVLVGRLIGTLERFAEEVRDLVEAIERYHLQHPDPIGPDV